jgi:hypothetical protein
LQELEAVAVEQTRALQVRLLQEAGLATVSLELRTLEEAELVDTDRALEEESAETVVPALSY